MRLAAILVFAVTVLKGQIDTSVTVPLLGINVSMQLPGGDLAKRFGANLAAGGIFAVKTRSNWLIGLEGNYFFGRNVREDVLSNLKNPDGFVVDNEGYPADLRVSERGLAFHLCGGRMFRFLSANPNSGLIVMLGAGFLQHRVKLYDAQQRVASVQGDLIKGYDRLTGGPSLMQFAGYLFLGEHRLVNFYFGFECYEAFTKSYRKLNYDTGQPDTRSRLDVLTGFRAGWVLPLYKKSPNDYYYN